LRNEGVTEGKDGESMCILITSCELKIKEYKSVIRGELEEVVPRKGSRKSEGKNIGLLPVTGTMPGGGSQKRTGGSQTQTLKNGYSRHSSERKSKGGMT